MMTRQMITKARDDHSFWPVIVMVSLSSQHVYFLFATEA